MNKSKESYSYLENILKNDLNPQNGLPQKVFDFASSIVPMINVDLLIRNKKGEILLALRDDKFSGLVWHIPGGIIRFKETIENRIHQVALKELGTDIIWNGKIIEINEIISDHQERGHFISLLVECSIDEGKFNVFKSDLNNLKSGDLFWFSSCPSDFIECQRPIYSKYFF